MIHFGAKLHQNRACQFASFAHQNVFLQAIGSNLGAKYAP
jgi:hypothetical protein